MKIVCIIPKISKCRTFSRICGSVLGLSTKFLFQELSESISKGDELVSMETERYCGVRPIAQDEQHVSHK